LIAGDALVTGHPVSTRRGPQLLPSILNHDQDGCVRSLSALGMLDTVGVIEIVENAPAFPEAGEYVGLDATTSLPPALCPDVLMDWESWWEWERLSVELCNVNETPRQILARLAVAVEHVRTWRPGQGELLARVQEAHRAARATLTNHPNPTNRFLSCHVFANWTAHLGAGLRTWFRSIETVVFLCEEGWTMREIDLWLRHFADPRLLARVWSNAERVRTAPK
jgi:hypothetical protein